MDGNGVLEGGIGVSVAGKGDGVNVVVGGAGVELGVRVVVDGKSGVQLGSGVRLVVEDGEGEAVKVSVAGNNNGVGDCALDVTMNKTVALGCIVSVKKTVLVAVAVATIFCGAMVHASHPMQ